MSHTVESIIELLYTASELKTSAGEKKLLRSFSKQFANNIPLTDRQLLLCLKKITAYQTFLETQGVDVDTVLLTTPLRMPLREIDRSQYIKIVKNKTTGKSEIEIKFDYSKEFSNTWYEVSDQLIGDVVESSTIKVVNLNENNVLELVRRFKDTAFIIDSDLLELSKKMEYMAENPTLFVTHIDVENDKLVLKNYNSRAYDYIEKNYTLEEGDPKINWLMTAKACGISYKSSAAVKEIENLTVSNSAKKILTSVETRFRIDPKDVALEQVVTLLSELHQYPVLCIVDETQEGVDAVLSAYKELQKYLSNDEITVFFRLSNGQPGHDEFNQFVRDNHLNNYIDSRTKVVFITKNRIPKPLVQADWQPKCAVVFSNYDYGKISSYLNDFRTVYYYNDSISMRHNKIKGARKIAQL
jgi:hypothetical protein